MHGIRLPFCLIGLCVFALSAASNQIGAQEFRVETSVYAAGAKQPLTRNLTLFSAGMAYDFPQASSETIVFDPVNQRFVLLDASQRTRTEVNLEGLGDYIAELKQRGLQAKQTYFYDPVFLVRYAADSRRLTLESDAITYRAVGLVPPASHAAAVSTYRQFTDWSARLNATHKGSFPPFARLILNGKLQEHNLLPEQVEVEYAPPGRSGEKAVFQSRQQFAWKLTDDDRRRIEEASRNVLEFTFVEDPREFLKNRR